MTNFNERTNTLLYKNIPLTLYSRNGDVFCVWEVSWRWGQTVILTQSSSCDHSSTSFSSWLGCSTVGHWGPKAAGLNLASCLQLTQAICMLVILLFNAHLLPLFFRLFTLVHLLIDSSVEGQYITLPLASLPFTIFTNQPLKEKNLCIEHIHYWYNIYI